MYRPVTTIAALPWVALMQPIVGGRYSYSRQRAQLVVHSIVTWSLSTNHVRLSVPWTQIGVSCRLVHTSYVPNEMSILVQFSIHWSLIHCTVYTVFSIVSLFLGNFQVCLTPQIAESQGDHNFITRHPHSPMQNCNIIKQLLHL